MGNRLRNAKIIPADRVAKLKFNSILKFEKPYIVQGSLEINFWSCEPLGISNASGLQR